MMDKIEKVARAIRARLGGCYGEHYLSEEHHLSECTDMTPGGNCQCADLAVAAIEAMMDWQPIETALKDGSPVLLTQGRDVAEGFWNRSPNSPRMPPYWATHRMVGNPGEQPTHWMPLPAPPK